MCKVLRIIIIKSGALDFGYDYCLKKLGKSIGNF